MKLLHHSTYASTHRNRPLAPNTNHRFTATQTLSPSSKKELPSRFLLLFIAVVILCLPSLHAAESYWPSTERRFAPSIWVDGFHPTMSISKMNSHWAKWAGPYYSDWIDPSRGEKMGIWFPAAGWKFFYVDEDRRPINPKDPNDPNYDWGFVERALASDAVKRDGATVNIRLDLEGKGMFPDWYKAAGYTTIPAGKHKSIVNWGNPHAVQELKDFITAFAKRYNDNKHLYTIAISEQGGSSKTKNAATIKVGVIKHIAKNFDHMMLSVFQNTGTWKELKGIPGIGRGISDAKPFFGSCGSSGHNYGDGGNPLCDCNAGGMW